MQSFAAWDSSRSGGVQSRQRSVLYACGVHEAYVGEFEQSGATAYQNVEVWMETLQNRNQKYHRHPIPTSEHLVGANGAGASPWWSFYRSYTE